VPVFGDGVDVCGGEGGVDLERGISLCLARAMPAEYQLRARDRQVMVYVSAAQSWQSRWWRYGSTQQAHRTRDTLCAGGCEVSVGVLAVTRK